MGRKIEESQLKFSILIGLIAIFCFYFQGTRWSESGLFSNIEIYMMSTILFFVIFGISGLLYNIFLRKKCIKIPAQYNKIAALLLLAGGGYFLVCCYFNELDQYAFPAKYFRHNIPPAIYIIILILFICMIYSVMRSVNGRNNLWRGIFATMIALVQGWFLYTPNPFLDNMGSISHIDAYTNSVINTLAWAPFEMYSASIYGHHGLLYLVPVKVLHRLGFCNWIALTIVIGIVGFIVFFVEYWCISQVIENDVVYAIAVLANAIVSFQIYPNQYYQMMPHRFLFQAIIFCGCILAYRKPRALVIRAVMWLMSSLAFVWNIETGIVVAVVWMLASMYLDGKEQGKYQLKTLVVNISYTGISFLASYGLVNVYNLAVGGNTVSVNTYIYPIGSDVYQIEGLQIVLMKPLCGYFLVISTMLSVIGLYFLKALFVKLSEKEYAAFLAAVMGLGMFTYYMNRAVTTNATIVGFALVILLAHICDRLAPFIMSGDAEKETNKLRGLWDAIEIKNVIGVFCLIILSSMALSSISSIGYSLHNKIETTWETESLSEFLQEANEKIPCDAAAFGGYTAQLYGLLDRNTGIYIADWEDIGTSWWGTFMNHEAIDHLNDLIDKNRYQYIVVETHASQYLPEGEYFQIVSMEYNEKVFEVYERRE